MSNALALSAHWFGTAVPGHARERLGHPAREEAAAYERLRARAPIGREGARLWADVRGVPDLRERLRFALDYAFPPAAYMRSWYGLDRDWQIPIYYARRFLRGALHIVSDPLLRERRIVHEPPEAWMVDQ